MKSIAVVLVCAAILLTGCSNNKPETTSGGATVGPAASSSSSSATTSASAPAEAQTDQVDACQYLTLEDAQKIEGAPMQHSPTQNKRVCMYVEVTPKANSMGPARLSAMVDVHNTMEEEIKAWNRLKEVRNIAPGGKNVQQIGGIGDEAWFTGNVEKGQVGVAAVIARKGKSDFTLDSMVLEYRASRDEMKAVAKKIAAQLQ